MDILKIIFLFAWCFLNKKKIVNNFFIVTKETPEEVDESGDLGEDAVDDITIRDSPDRGEKQEAVDDTIICDSSDRSEEKDVVDDITIRNSPDRSELKEDIVDDITIRDSPDRSELKEDIVDDITIRDNPDRSKEEEVELTAEYVIISAQKFQDPGDTEMKRKVVEVSELEQVIRRMRINDSLVGTEISENTARNVDRSEEKTKFSEVSDLEEEVALSISELRSYQRRMVESIMEENTIVLLPTGAGKTLIAAECAKQMDGKTLFLVPTCSLVKQQAAAIRNWTGLRVAEWSGDHRTILHAFDILVSTPELFHNAQLDPMNSYLSWEIFKFVVFDEVHHCLKSIHIVNWPCH